jgi:hypothetical protein
MKKSHNVKNIKTWSDLAKLKVGCIESYFYIEIFKKKNITCVKLVQATQAWKMLESNRVDIFIQQKEVGILSVSKIFSKTKDQYKYLSLKKILPEEGLYLILSRVDMKKAERFKKEFDRLLRIEKKL